jgi:hypothetical protein
VTLPTTLIGAFSRAHRGDLESKIIPRAPLPISKWRPSKLLFCFALQTSFGKSANSISFILPQKLSFARGYKTPYRLWGQVSHNTPKMAPPQKLDFPLAAGPFRVLGENFCSNPNMERAWGPRECRRPRSDICPRSRDMWVENFQM